MSPDELAQAFGRASVRAGALTPVLEDFALHERESIKTNFIEGGRPVAWVPSHDHPGHVSTLVDTGQLMDSTTAYVENGTDVVLAAGGGGQPAAKAPTLQYGARFMAKRRGGQFVTKRSRKDITRHEIVIDPRPYLVFQSDDLLYLDHRITDFVFETQEFAVAA